MKRIWEICSIGNYMVPNISTKSYKSKSLTVWRETILLELLCMKWQVSCMAGSSHISQKCCNNFFSIPHLVHSDRIFMLNFKKVYALMSATDTAPYYYTFIMEEFAHNYIWPFKTQKVSYLLIDKAIQMAFIRKL